MEEDNMRAAALGTAEVVTAAAFTPGPWDYVPSTEYHGPYVTSEYGLTICDCYVMSEPGAFSTRNGGPSKPVHFLHEMADPNARLIAAAPELLTGLQGTLKLLRKAQDVLTMYLHPDSYDADHAVNLLLELLDGPEQRAIETPARAAIAKATAVPSAAAIQPSSNYRSVVSYLWKDKI